MMDRHARAIVLNATQSVSCKRPRLALLAMALYAASARADDSDTPLFSFSGFGTVGAVHSSEDKADFTSIIFKPDGAGHSRDWSLGVDSLLGAQITANFTPQISGVVQVISEQNYDGSYQPHVEWANIKYQFTPDFSVRVGRTVSPAFLLSETRKVAYTYPWVRPPLDVYHLLPITANDGMDASYSLHFGEVMNTVQAVVGQKNTNLVGGGKIAARDFWAIINTAEYGPLTVRATYSHANLTIPSLNALFDAFRQFGPQGVAIAERYESRAKPVPFLGFGASYDPGNWFVMSEWSHNDTHSSLGKSTAWYVSGGYRFGKFTPYVTYAQARTDNLSDPGLDIAALPPFLDGPANGLNAALNSILSAKPVTNTVSLGARWDFMKNSAFKLQFDHTRIGAGSAGGLSNLQPGFQTGGKVNVISASIDFVF